MKPKTKKTQTKISEDWKKVKFNIIVKYIKGKKPKEVNEEEKESYLPYLSTEYLRNNEKPKFAKPSSDIILVNDGELVLLWDGSNAGEFFIGKKGILSSTMVKFQFKKEEVNQKFLFYLLKTKEKFLSGQTRGTGIPHVDKTVLENFKILLPPLQEQHAIVKIFSTVDEAIQKSNEKIEKTERLKRGLMEELLNDKKWKIVKLYDIVEFIKGKKPKIMIDEQKGNYLPYLSTDYLRVNGETKYTNSSKDVVLVKDGELILLWDGSNAGEFFEGKEGVLSSTMVKITLKDKIYNKKFLFYLLKTKENFIKSQTKGTGIPHVDSSVVNSLKLPLPSLQEQQKIATIFSTIDKKLELERKRKQKLERMKKGLMQDLLTGKKRANVEKVLEVGR